MTLSPIKEDFIHFLWRTKKIPHHHINSTDHRQIEIIDYGTYNTDSGPDFFNAKIKIDGIVWAGNIEMHVFSSDWYLHKHQNDKAYENVILHVVYEHDKDITQQKNGDTIPTLELKGKIPKVYLEQYLGIVQSKDPIPCGAQLKSVSPEKINLLKYSMAIERLSQKAISVESILQSVDGNWEETLYIMVARYFGARVNAEPFERLARSLPLSIIQKNKNNLPILEALYFGQAGMLIANYQDDYYQQLKKEYAYQQNKLKLTPIDAMTWKFSRLRPQNFPTIRISQFSNLMFNTSFLFSQIIDANHPKEILHLLSANATDYWTNHYKFDTKSKEVQKITGDDFVYVLLINAVAPVLFLYGKSINTESYIDTAIQILEDVPAEKNQITTLWKSLGIRCGSGFDSQALIQLKTKYCDQMRCMECAIGNDIMNIKSEG